MQLPPGKVVAKLKLVSPSRQDWNNSVLKTLEGSILVGGELIPVMLCLGDRHDEWVLRVRPCPERRGEEATFDPDPIPF